MPVVFQKKGQIVLKTPTCLGLNVLGHAQLEELNIGSQCGGHGVCGKDKVLIQSGNEILSPWTAEEKAHLTLNELQNGYRLACQCYANSTSLEIKVEI